MRKRPDLKNQYDGYLLIKFFSEKKYLDEFLKGTLFFNRSDYYMYSDEKGRVNEIHE